MKLTPSTWITIGCVVAIVGLAMVIHPGAAGAPPRENEAPALEVGVVTLSARVLRREVKTGGFLAAVRDVTVSAERAGRVRSLPVAEGRRAKAGAPIAHLDDVLERARLDSAKAAYREAALDPDTPAASLAHAEYALRQARRELELRHPVAPLDGVVEVHHVEAGEYVVAGAPLVDILDPDLVEILVEVDAELVNSIGAGKEVPIDVASLHVTSAIGTVHRVADRADPATRRFRVEIRLDSRDGQLKPGMYGEASFVVVNGRSSLYAPKSAVRRDEGGKTGVFVVNGSVARWIPVGVSEVYGEPELWQLDPGVLEEGAMIVASGFQGLRDGSSVEVR